MGQLVLLVVAAAWAAVLVPPLLRSRIENRPNSSVSDFRNQLSSLQRAMPTRGVAMRSMGRPLAQSPLSRPAATGRPGMSPHARSHGGVAAAPPRLQPVDRRRPTPPVRTFDASPRARSHAERVARPVDARNALRRRRATVLFVLVLSAASTLFLAATTKSDPMIWTAGAASVALLGYVCLLGQLRQRENVPAAAPVVRRAVHREVGDDRRHLQARPAVGDRQAPVRRVSAARPPSTAVRRPADRWSHAV